MTQTTHAERPCNRQPNQILGCIRVRWIPATDYKPSRYSVTADGARKMGRGIRICSDGVSEWEAAQKWIDMFIVKRAGLENAVPMTGYRFNNDVYFAWKFIQEDE